jgi:hypothetical protein
MEGSNCRKQQSSCQVGRFEPFHSSTEETYTDQSVIPIKKLILVSKCAGRSIEIVVYEHTHRNLVPGPYWPDNGHAHTTFTALLLTFVVATLRSSSISIGKGEGRTGMIFQ